MWLSLSGVAIHAWWAWKWDGCQVVIREDPPRRTPESCDVVVCMHNEASNVETFVARLNPALAVAHDAGMKISVVAVNHGSTDNTGDALARAVGKDSRWQVVNMERRHQSKKEALHAGIQASQGQVILVTDADCVPANEDWINQMTSGATVMWDVQLGLSLPLEPKSVLMRLQRLEARRLAQRAAGAVLGGRPYLGFGRNMAMTRAIWNRVGGFRSHLHLPSGDDDVWLQSAVNQGARVHINVHPKAQTISTWPATWAAWRKQKTRHFTASKAYPFALKLRLAIPHLAWLLIAVGVVHNTSGTSVALASLALMIRTLTFGMFLNRAGQPWHDAWEILLEPLVSVFRFWAWLKGQTSEPIPWK